jgi:RNA polymerase sigma-70 factor (ECF subfamily)
MSGGAVSGPVERQGPTDASLVRRAQDGDVAAFDVLVRRHGGRAYRVALRLLNNTHDAEDATQDALVAAWRALHRFRGDSAFSTWLYRIVTNTALNQATRQRKPAVPIEADLAAADSAGPGAVVEQAGRHAALYRAIAALPAELRVPLVWHQFEGLSYEQIAGMLDVSIGTVKGRTFRARRLLADSLRQWR